MLKKQVTQYREKDDSIDSKKWVICFLGIAAMFFFLLCVLNYMIDPFGYFRSEKGDYFPYDPNTGYCYQRKIKAEYIKKHGKEYDAFIIGGSKAGVLRPDKMTELDGYRYYNAFCLKGNFKEYLDWTKFIIQNTNAKKLVLHLSSIEVNEYSVEKLGDIYTTPSVLEGKNSIKEKVSFLTKNIDTCVKEVLDFKKNQGIQYPAPITGERNLDKYYSQYKEGRKIYVKKHVLEKYSMRINHLFTTTPNTSAAENNLTALKEIKKVCEENEVELLVVIGATFTSELNRVEGEGYWDYLRELSNITEFWDFSTSCVINRNPYNFYNDGHYNFETSDTIVDIIAGKTEIEGFGVYVTKENRNAFIERRKQVYEELKKEYEETGTIKPGMFYDKSRLQ